MIKICKEVTVLPISIIFKTDLQSDTYPNMWIKVHIHKKDDLFYQSVVKVEKCIYNTIYSIIRFMFSQKTFLLPTKVIKTPYP